MKLKLISALLLIFMLAGAVSAVPLIPMEFQGSVTIDGSSAPAGTVIIAKINSMERGRITTTTAGTYGSSGAFGDRLEVHGTEADRNNRASVTFWTGGIKADQEVVFESRVSEVLALSFDSSAQGGSDDTPVSYGTSPFNLNELSTGDAGGGQQKITIDRNIVSSEGATLSTSGTTITLTKEKGSGWSEFVIETTEAPTETAGEINAVISGVTANSERVSADVGGTTGIVETHFEIEMNRMPGSDASILSSVAKMPDSDAQSAFSLIAEDEGKEIADTAYTLNLQKTNIVNGEDGITSAKIVMKVSETWVSAHGGPENVVIFRYDNEKNPPVSQKLAVEWSGPVSGIYTFTADSPDGLSVFSLAALALPGGGGSSPPGGGGSSPGTSDTKSSISFDPDKTVIPDSTTVPSPTLSSPGNVPPASDGDSSGEIADNSGESAPDTMSGFPVLPVAGVIAIAGIGGVLYILSRKP